MARSTAEDPDDGARRARGGGGRTAGRTPPAADAPAPHAPAGPGSRIAPRFAAAGGLPCDPPGLHATARRPDLPAAVAMADEPQPAGRAPARDIRDAR